MSDHRALAAVTVTLRNLIRAAITEVGLPGVDVRTGPPRALPEQEVRNGRVHVFLYNTTPNGTWRNGELPYRLADGTLIRKPQLALDLHFLLTFYGDERRQLPNRLLGITAAALHVEAYPASNHFPRGDEGSVDLPPLEAAGLDRQTHPLRFVPEVMGTEELSKIWGLFAHIPYVLSAAYSASVVLIEPPRIPEPPPPVTRAQMFFGEPLPELQGLVPQTLSFQPGAKIQATGRHLASDFLKVVVGDVDMTPDQVRATRVDFTLPSELAAGINLVRLVQGHQRGDSEEIRWDMESNALALVIRPVITNAQVLSSVPFEDDPNDPLRQVVLHVRFAPPVRTKTSAYLLLNGRAEHDASPRSYRLQGWIGPPSGDLFEVTASMTRGRYRLRVQMAGVQSDTSSPGLLGSLLPTSSNSPEVVIE